MALLLGERVTLRKPSLVRKGWRKLRRQCSACLGAGKQRDFQTTFSVKVCPGCNGWGSVWEWQKVK